MNSGQNSQSSGPLLAVLAEAVFMDTYDMSQF